METAQVVALLGFVVLALLVAVVTRRAGAVLYRTRIAESYRGAVGDLSRRVAQSLGEIGAAIEPVRRHEVDGTTIADALTAARDAATRYAAEARSLAGPPAAALAQARMVEELERAGRALALVEHGCALSLEGRPNERGPESEVSIKRGYLNLIHARDSFAEHAEAAMRAAEGASPARHLGRPRS